MTASSTKVSASTQPPAARSHGAGMHAGPPIAGPVPVPRVVGNRRIRGGGIALATMLLAFGAALSGIALVSVAKTSSYLAVAQPVAVGGMITAQDLTTVQISGGGGLTLIPAAEVGGIVGRHAAVSLVPGSLLVPSQLTDKTLVGPDQAQIGITVRANSLPAARLAPGQQITLVPLSPAGSTGDDSSTSARSFVATIVDISAVGQDGAVIMHIAVAANLATTVVMENASGGFGAFLKPGS